MLFYPSPREGLAWIEASDAFWEARLNAVYTAAKERGEDEAAEEDDSTT